MRLAFFGSGEFGVPTLAALHRLHEVVLVVSNPDRPAGRGRRAVPTPVTAFAAPAGLRCEHPEDPNAGPTADLLEELQPDAVVVIAYGHKLGRTLLDGRFAINLHASLLPRYRGAAPINWAIVRGETETGVSVITLAERMDAGLVLAARSLGIDPRETAGELHDRLAELGPDLVLEVLASHEAGTLRGVAQDPEQVSWAPRLKKADGTVDFDQPATVVRQRIHGLTPWPGCRVELSGHVVRVHRVEVVPAREIIDMPAGVGELGPGGLVRCGQDAVRLLEVQPPGGRLMAFEEFARGRKLVGRGASS